VCAHIMEGCEYDDETSSCIASSEEAPTDEGPATTPQVVPTHPDCTCTNYPQNAVEDMTMCEDSDTCVEAAGACNGEAFHCDFVFPEEPETPETPASEEPQPSEEPESTQQFADSTSCTSHEDCTNVQVLFNDAFVDIGVTYCYENGDGDLKCAGNANDCCSCEDNDSFDKNPDNCPAASDCDNFCGGECDFDTIPDGCEMPTDCAGFNAAVGSGGCCENCLQCVKDDLNRRLQCATTTAAPAKQVKFSMKIEGMTAEKFEEKKEQVKEGIANSLEVDPTLVEVAVKEQALERLRRILSNLELDVTVLTDDENAVTDKVSNDGFATTLSDNISQSTKETITVSEVTDPVVEDNPNASKNVTTEEDDDMSTGVLILTIVCIITTILICAYFAWFCCVREDEKSVEMQIQMNTNANRSGTTV